MKVKNESTIVERAMQMIEGFSSVMGKIHHNQLSISLVFKIIPLDIQYIMIQGDLFN